MTTRASKDLLGRFPDIEPTTHGLRAIAVVTAELVRDTCGYTVPFTANVTAGHTSSHLAPWTVEQAGVPERTSGPRGSPFASPTEEP